MGDNSNSISLLAHARLSQYDRLFSEWPYTGNCRNNIICHNAKIPGIVQCALYSVIKLDDALVCLQS